MLVVGAPWLLADGRLLNCAFVAARGRMVGAVPKSAPPNYGEFYEKRWFVSGADVAVTIDDDTFGAFPLATNQLCEVGQTRFAIEICEDLWAPDPIGNRHALAGADLILNPSASTDLIGKADYRRDLVRMTSGTRICGYLFASCGPSRIDERRGFRRSSDRRGERPTARRIERFALDGTRLIADFDQESCATIAPSTIRLRRRRAGDVREHRHRGDADAAGGAGANLPEATVLFRPTNTSSTPARRKFCRFRRPASRAGRSRRAPKRWSSTIGRLDSTLAFLVCLDALAKRDRPLAALHALTMPGGHQRRHAGVGARRKAGGATLVEIPIDAAVKQHLVDLDHPAGQHGRGVRERAGA